MSFKKEMETVKKQVEHLLETYPQTRDNDFYMIVLWAKIFGGMEQYIYHIPYYLIREHSGKPTTLRRIRQLIQNNEKRYPPTDPEVMRKRKQRREDFREWFGRRGKQ